MEFKEKVVAYMQEKGLTLEAFAKEANLEFNKLNEYFNRPTWDKMENQFFFQELGEDFEVWLSQFESKGFVSN